VSVRWLKGRAALLGRPVTDVFTFGRVLPDGSFVTYEAGEICWPE
jgi:hypothetical protein